MFGKFNKVLMGVALIGGLVNENYVKASTESKPISPMSHSMKVITEETFQQLDRTSQNHFIESSIIVFSNPEMIALILERITRGEVDFPESTDFQKLPCNVTLLYTKLQDRPTSMRAKMKEAEDTSRLDNATIAEIEKVISPEAMQRIASRHASNPSNVLLIGEYVENLFTFYSEKTARKLKSVIGDLLQDESPNKDWILSLISELNHSETTRKLYDELLAMIKR